MALLQGVDYSFSRPSIQCMWDKGMRFVVRYLSNTNSHKNASKAELDSLIRQGYKVVLVYEDSPGSMLRGYAEGVADARVAKVKAAEVGCPTNRPIYFALDVDPNALSNDEMRACQRYLDGNGDVLGARRVGLYGGWRAIENLNCAWKWQTYAWSGGRVSNRAHFRQYKNGVDMCGGEVDLNEAYQPDFGQWPLTIVEEDEVGPSDWSDKDVDRVRRIIRQEVGGLVESKLEQYVGEGKLEDLLDRAFTTDADIRQALLYLGRRANGETVLPVLDEIKAAHQAPQTPSA